MPGMELLAALRISEPILETAAGCNTSLINAFDISFKSD
jgi:hypothetical protein